jgi:Flp pilus assembly protein TadG
MKRTRRPGQQGQSLVELAIMLPVLLLLLLGMAEFARLFSNYLTLSQAAREGARLAITGASDSAVIQRVRETAPTLDPSQLTITITPAGPRTSGSDVTVVLQYPVPLMTPIISQVVGGTVDLQVQTVARME